MDAEAYLANVTAAGTFATREGVAAEARARENDDRRVFAAGNAGEVARVSDIRRSLVRVFDEHTGDARFATGERFPEEDALPLLFPRAASEDVGTRRPALTVSSRAAFERNFGLILGHNALHYMNWDNVIAAGGAVLGCVRPVPDDVEGVLEQRRYYQDTALGGSDIDLFLYGLTEEEANAKLIEIYESVCKACPFEVVCFRSAHAVTIISQFPYRHIQVVLRVYSSVYEVLAGFDVDSCTFAYDGHEVYTTCRGHYALFAGYNTIDLSRRSPSYEMRLAKYARRGFAVHVPGYDRARVDPNLFDMPWAMLRGLAKLVVLEQLRTPAQRYEYMHRQAAKKTAHRRTLPTRRQLERMEKAGIGEQSNYATVILPWGPDYDAQSVMRIMKRKDIQLNGRYFAWDREYRLHPCFFGTAREVLLDMAPDDPPIPDDVDPATLEGYVRGPLTWMRDDPGRQQVGSFHPLTADDWEDGAYMLPTTLALFRAVNMNDVSGVRAHARPDNIYVRDFLGRTPLHLAVMAGAGDVARALLQNRLVDPALRMPDGRNALHLCAQYNQPAIAEDVIAALRDADAAAGEGGAPRRATLAAVIEQEDTVAHPLRPLHHAVLLGHDRIVDVFLRAGANATSHVKRAVDPGINRKLPVPFVTPIVLLPEPETDDEAAAVSRIVARLAAHGACTQVGLLLDHFNTVFHALANLDKPRVLRAVIEHTMQRDATLATKMLSMISMQRQLPVTCALGSHHVECVRVLYDATRALVPSDEVCAAARVRAGQIDIAKAPYRLRSAVNGLRAVTTADFAPPLLLAVHTLAAAVTYLHQVTAGDRPTGFTTRRLYLRYSTPGADERPGDLRARVEGALAMVEWLLQRGASLTDEAAVPSTCSFKLYPRGEQLLGSCYGQKKRTTKRSPTYSTLAWLAFCADDIEESMASCAAADAAEPAMAAFVAHLPAGYQHLLGVVAVDVSRQHDEMRRLALTLVSLRQVRELLVKGAEGNADAVQRLRTALLEGLDAAVAGTPPAPEGATPPVPTPEDIQERVARVREHLFASHSVATGDARSWMQTDRVWTVPASAQPVAVRAHEAVYDGSVAKLEGVLQEQVGFPLLSVLDVLGNTLFVTALLRPHDDVAAVMARLLVRAQREHTPQQQLVFAEEGTGRRFDNFKLLQCDGRGEDVVMAEGGSDEEREAAAAVERHNLRGAVDARATVSRLNPADLLCTAGHVPACVLDGALPAEWRAELAAVRVLGGDVPGFYELAPLEIAVVQDRPDVVAMMLKFLKRYPAADGGRASITALKGGRPLRLAVALDRVAIVKLFFQHAGGGVNWENLALELRLSSVFPSAKKKPKSTTTRYRGFSSKLDRKRGGKQTPSGSGDEDGATVYVESMTIVEMAAFYGATGVLEWATSGNAAVQLLEGFLAEEPAGPVQTSFVAFVGDVAEATGERPAVRAQLPDVRGRSPAEALVLLGVNGNDTGGGAAAAYAGFNARGESLMLLALQGHAAGTVEFLLRHDPSLKDAACGRGLYTSHAVKMSRKYMRIAHRTGTQGTALADPSLHHSPCIIAAREGALEAFRVLLLHGADLERARHPLTGASVLHTVVATAHTPWSEGFCKAIADVRGVDALRALLAVADNEGVTGMMAVCGQAHHDNLRCLVELCSEVLASGGGRGERCRRGGSVLHAAAKSHSEQMLRALSEWMAQGEALREDAKGATPVDIALQRRDNPGFKKCGRQTEWFRSGLGQDKHLPRELVGFEAVHRYVLEQLARDVEDAVEPLTERQLSLSLDHEADERSRLRIALLHPHEVAALNALTTPSKKKRPRS